jgi:2-polyprenyl-3-methyl-5-hydroxy-6-metoxy-1,4-benzoquinol methylase
MTLRWKIAQAIEIRWWQRYLKNKSTADYSAWKMQYWQTFLKNIGLETLLTEGGTISDFGFRISDFDDKNPKSEIRNPKSILDAGCGPAGIFMVLNNHSVDALDPLLDSYEKNLMHFKKTDYPHVHFINQPLENFDKTNKYDVVFCLNAINHVADLSKCFDILVQATKEKGTLVVSIDAHNFTFLKKVFQQIPGDILHPHQFDLKEYADMLTSRGCTIENTVLYRKELIFNYYILVVRKN